MSGKFDLNVESALTDLEGILHAIELVRMDGGLNKPGPEFHALAVLSKLAVEKAAELRNAIYPQAAKGEEADQ
jgi:hypothetical protein